VRQFLDHDADIEIAVIVLVAAIDVLVPLARFGAGEAAGEACGENGGHRESRSEAHHRLLRGSRLAQFAREPGPSRGPRSAQRG